ncbi:MAG: chemotaxis response regulator protein-glutamate methylesterase [Thermodesulfobacteriota bacterium]|nr:chemotaxis response regulator protein-glutamate methylesterase [Thermodesulfobacteriota bacterium]
MNTKTTLLIVDDSRIFRSAIEESLAAEDDIEVIGSVWNGMKAIEFIRSNPPDLVTLDVEMPQMDGLETLKAIQEINASHSHSKLIGVIMLSSFTHKGADITIKALEMGAFDFVRKPERKDPRENIEVLRLQLLTKIRHFASRRIFGPAQPHINLPPLPEIRPELSASLGVRSVMIGVSTGGPRALANILPQLCESVDVPIFIVQHMPPTFTESLARSLDVRCRYTVMEGKHNHIVQERHVYIAPGGKHMLIEEREQTVKTVVNNQPPENGCRPSVDVLFRSGATVYGKDVIAVVLTGMGMDGTKGAEVLKRVGAFIIAQDKETSVVWGMPGSVQISGNADEVLPLNEISNAVIRRCLSSA